jgi:hypothetical protein
MRPIVLVAGILVLVNCARGELNVDEVRQGATASPAAMSAPPGMVRPTADSVSVRRVGDQYEIEIQSPAGFPARSFDPVLHIGDFQFRRYHVSPTAGDFGVVFTLTSAEFAALPADQPIAIVYGRTRATAPRTFGTFRR